MSDLYIYLNDWYNFYNDKNENFDPKVEILVQCSLEKTDKKAFELMINKMDLRNTMVGTCINDFKKSELAEIISLIEKYNGIFKFELGDETGSELHKYEDNIIWSCFPTPILAFDCMREYIKK